MPSVDAVSTSSVIRPRPSRRLNSEWTWTCVKSFAAMGIGTPMVAHEGAGCLDDRRRVRCVQHAIYVGEMMKRNVTVQLDEQTVQKARVVAAKRGSSISRLLAEQIDLLARQDDDYDRAMHDA